MPEETMPTEGGSYIRKASGKLERKESTAPAPATPPEPEPPAAPPATPAT